MYISVEGYKSNLHPEYCDDKDNVDSYQIATYYVAGEIARRYHARYLIDMGCGNGGKIALYKNEFHVIGIDYELNLKVAKKLYPDVTFIEANLDLNGTCTIDLHPEILSQAVVFSADVIEHIVDPFYCFTKLLKVGVIIIIHY